MTSATTSVDSYDSDHSLNTLQALKLLWPSLKKTVEPFLNASPEVDKSAAESFIAMLNSTHIAEPTTPAAWDIEGFNHCISQGSKAIRQLLKDGASAGGCQSFNTEHCIQIANELMHQVEINRKACISGNRAGVTIRPVQDSLNSTEQARSVPAYKFDRLVQHAKSQDKTIARQQAELNLYQIGRAHV